MTKVALISDLHGYLPPIDPDTDLIIVAGDIAPDNTYNGDQSTDDALTTQEKWFSTDFHNWMEDNGRIPVWGTWGNHDFYGEQIQNIESDDLNLLTDQTRIIHGIRTYFTPWSRRIGGWAFMDTDHNLAEKWAKIPDDTEVLVVHGPPKGIADLVISGHRNWTQFENVGSETLLRRLLDLKHLKLVVCGHIHEARGVYGMETIGCPILNVAVLDSRYKPYPEGVIYIDWPHEEGYGHGI